MLKSYSKAQGAQETAFWEDYFASQSYDYLVQSFSSDPLRPLFERYCSNGALVLEGGCGLGNFLPCLRNLGGRPIGLDFAADMLMQVRKHDTITPLTAGDVCNLPFPDKTFDAYYSGGVFEHFEAGPEAGLADAFRVLKPGGILLASVPYHNAIRSRLVRRPTDLHGLITVPIERESVNEPPAGYTFFQYYYRGPEFRKRAESQGFEVLGEQPYSMWRGMTDLKFFRWLDHKYASQAASSSMAAASQGGRSAPSGRQHSSMKQRLKYWIFAEDRTVPVVGSLVNLGCELAANMRMYVCRRR